MATVAIRCRERTVKFQNKPYPILPGLVYDLNMFSEFFTTAIGTIGVGEDWVSACKKCVRGVVLEVGGGTGRLSRVAHRAADKYWIVEQNKWFANHLRDLLSGKNVEVIQGRFYDDTKSHQWNCILMHQNTFLELINETPLVGLVEAVVSSLLPGGVALFDYPTCEKLDKSGHWRTLYSGAFKAGEICYKYRHLDSIGEMHIVELMLSIDGQNVWCNAVPLAFQLPKLEAVTALFERAGCIVRCSKAPSIQSFYSTQLTIVEAEKR